jgi:hypothetical protein
MLAEWSKDTKPLVRLRGDEALPMTTDSKGGATGNYTRFGQQSPPGHNSRFWPKALHCIWTWGSTKGPTVVTTAAYPKTNRGIRGKRRTTCNLDTTSTPPITTIARLCLHAHNNTIALRINTEWRTHEFRAALTYHWIAHMIGTTTWH